MKPGTSRHSVELQLARARQKTTPSQVQATPGVFDGGMESGVEGGGALYRSPEEQAITAILDGMQNGVMTGGIPARNVPVDDFDS